MKRLTPLELIYAFNMAFACAISYVLTTELLGGFVDRGDTLLGGMWAAVATLFVFRETREGSLTAGISRLAASCVSFVLCFIYVALLPVNAAGIGFVIGVGTIVMLLLGRREDIVTTGITTIVVLVACAINPNHALAQPPLRLLDTVVGIGVGMLVRWAASYAVSAGIPQSRRRDRGERGRSMTEYLIAVRAVIILWTNLAVMPTEIVFDAIEAELKRRGVEP